MSLPALDNLVRIGQLKSEPRNDLEIERMLDMARSRLADARSQKLRGHWPARLGRQRLLSGSCPSAHDSRSTPPSHNQSPLCSCALLRSPGPACGRTCTSGSAPMLGAQTKAPPFDWRG